MSKPDCNEQGRGDAEMLRERAGSCKEQPLQGEMGSRWKQGSQGRFGRGYTGYGMTGRVEHACSAQGLGRGGGQGWALRNLVCLEHGMCE